MTHALLNFPRTADITWCRGSGKSFGLGLLAAFWAYRDGWTVIITAPKKDQCWSIMEWVHYALDRLLKPRQYIFNNRYEIAIRGRGKVICLSGDESANTQGKHGHVVMCDEKQDMDVNVVTESFIPMLANFDGMLIMSGVGGDPACVGETLGKKAEFRHEYPYQEHLKFEPTYSRIVEYERSVMLPQEFAAHFECKPLDVSERLLIPVIQGYTDAPDSKTRGLQTVIGIDWGKFDKTIATVTDRLGKQQWIREWLVMQGSYAKQLEAIVPWLNEKVDYDYVVSEDNGVGGAPSDILIQNCQNVFAVMVDNKWKTKMARELAHMASDGTLRYNANHQYAAMFHKDITHVEYRMSNLNEITFPPDKGHSDFLSSLMLTRESSRTVLV